MQLLSYKQGNIHSDRKINALSWAIQDGLARGEVGACANAVV